MFSFLKTPISRPLPSLFFHSRPDKNPLVSLSGTRSQTYVIVHAQGPFVAAFASSNLGDASPNVKGPRCQKSGKPCDIPGPSCGVDELCVASGPGADMKESTKIIARRLFDKAYVSRTCHVPTLGFRTELTPER